MSLVFVHEVYTEEEFDALDALRKGDPGDFTAEADKQEALNEIKRDLLALDRDTQSLCCMRPHLRWRYKEMHRQACVELEKRIEKLNLYCVRRTHGQ